MALDEPRDNDEKFEIEGFTYLINEDFLEKAKPISVDFEGIGYKLTCGIDFSRQAACSSCGTGNTSCS
ncbi:MAG: hypothetical protein ACOC3W_02605 [Thermodesulfobacteriota bacterium]